MELTLSAAARTTGKGKSTIHRAIKAGKLSARRTDDGSYMIDTSELARVFQLNAPAHPVGTTREAEEPHREPQGTELAELRVKVVMLGDQLARERETVDDLRKRLDRAEERVHALTYQTQELAGRQAPPRAGGLLHRLFGRARYGS